MTTYDYDIGVIGGGAAGLTIASGASQLGAKTLLVEQEKELGGDCLHYGCIPSKTLIKSAHVYQLMRNARQFGLPSVNLPPVEFKEVSKRIKSVIEIIQKHDSVERFCKLGVKVEFGSPLFKDEHTIELNGQRISAKKWAITTGSSPSIPPIKGLDTTPFITNKEIFYLDNLPKSMIVLGAGPIAIEMAQAFCRLGTSVTVIQRSNQILSKEDKDMADEVMNVLAKEGITFYLSSTVVSIRKSGNEKEITLINGADKTITCNAETLFVALGRVPNLEGLGLSDIGVEFDQKGIKVDKNLRTTQKHIYAAGDIIGKYQFTHAAGYEGGIVISNAVFHLPRKVDYTYMPWCTYTNPELANIGLNEKMAKDAGIEYSVWIEKFKDNDRGLAEGESAGMIKMLLDKKEKPIGVQICGLHAGDLLGEWVAALNGKVSLSSIASSVHPYPTLGEINKKVVGSLYSKKIFSDKVRKGLKLFFNLKGRACECSKEHGGEK